MSAKHTPGEWVAVVYDSINEARENSGFDWITGKWFFDGRPASVWLKCPGGGTTGLPGSIETTEGNAYLIAAAPDQHAEMLRFLPVLERAEADPAIWEKLTQGLGIATANGFRAAIAKAKGGAQ